MNIMEELSNEKPKSSKPMVFSKSIKQSAPSFFSFNNDSSSATTSVSSSSANTIPLGFLDWKMFFIFILLIIVVLSYYGINVLNILGDAINSGVSGASPAISSFLEVLGYSTGKALNKTAELGSDAIKTGADIAEGTVQNVGNLMIGTNQINQGPPNPYDPQPDTPEDSIQKSLTSSKTKWCLAGEYQNKRGCIDISESDKCLSGKVFPTREACLGNQGSP